MSGIDNPGRHGLADRQPGDPGAGLSARADSGFAGRDRTLGRDAARDRTDARSLAELSERAAALVRRIGEHGGRHDRVGEDEGVADPRATLLASAWQPPAEPLATTPAAPAEVASPARHEAAAERAAGRIAEALAAEVAPVPGAPIALRIDLADLALPFGAVLVNLTKTDLDVVLVGAGTGAALPAGLADELARTLAARLRGRRISVVAAEDRSQTATPFGMIRSILEGEA